MKREFLEGLGIEKEKIDKILDENSQDIGKEKGKTAKANDDLAALRQQLADKQKKIDELEAASGDGESIKAQLDALQTKYDTETAQYKAQIADRDYMDAANAAVSDVKFSSKSAKSAFMTALKEKKLEIKDGKLDGFDDYLKEQKESDPDAFAPEGNQPKIVQRIGAGGPPANENKGAAYAKMFNEMYATPTNKE